MEWTYKEKGIDVEIVTRTKRDNVIEKLRHT